MSTSFFAEYPPVPGTVLESADVTLEPLAGKTVAIIGFGTMGRAQAHNLRRGGVGVVVGCRAHSDSIGRATDEGFRVMSVAAAVTAGQIVMLMLPDQAMARVFTADIRPHLGPDTVLGFAHGFAVSFDQVDPGVRPCFLAAPKGQGDMLLEAHARGGGVPGLLAVTESSPVATWDLAAAYAKAVGCLHGGGFVTTFRQECVSDQFGEQVVLCGGVLELLKAAFDIMVDGGYGEQNAYFECVHELKLITDLLHRHGIDGMRARISGTAAYGGLTRGPRVIDEATRARMRDILREIETGTFAREFLDRHDDASDGTAALRRREAAGPLAATGRRVLPRLNQQPKEAGDDGK